MSNIEELEKIRQIPMLFILGKGRSGTTLLQSMLNSHPNVVAPPESKFMILFYPRFRRIRKWNEKNIHDFINLLCEDQLFAKVWRVNKDKLTSYLISVKEQLDYALVCKIVYYFTKEQKGNILLISDKNPIYCLFISKIRRLFPEAKFIHMLRDPRDTILSHITTFSVKNTYYKAQQWLHYNLLIEKNKKELPDSFFSLSYESLVENPEPVLKDLCKFLNISFDAEMLKRELPDSVGSDKTIMGLMGQTHKNLYDPIQTSSIGKWRKEMKPVDIAITSIITAQYAHEKGNYIFSEEDYRNVPVSHSKITRWKYIYIIWQMFTRTRYASLRVNMLYSKIKRSIRKDKLPIWEYF